MAGGDSMSVALAREVPVGFHRIRLPETLSEREESLKRPRIESGHAAGAIVLRTCFEGGSCDNNTAQLLHDLERIYREEDAQDILIDPDRYQACLDVLDYAHDMLSQTQTYGLTPTEGQLLVVFHDDPVISGIQRGDIFVSGGDGEQWRVDRAILDAFAYAREQGLLGLANVTRTATVMALA